MSGYLQYSNYGDDDEQQVKRKVASAPTMQSDKNQPKRILRTNQRTLRSRPNQGPSKQPQQPQPQPQPQHKYVQELIQKIHSYENDEDVSDSESDDNNYAPLANTNASMPNPTTTIQQQFQTDSVPNRNRFPGANPDDLSPKWNPSPAKEPFSFQGAKALASQYLPSVFQASSVGDDSETKDIMMQKLDRIISLLEDQHDEKTGHVTEELVLYCFLGVFIIFIVDSFARAGKYVR
jgi:hypothetical protein